ncbi:helix-turn-helix domain-containing protein [Scytonema sp. PRP1]|uniref:helix-turn-helix domain-containing protein n=1 Tax=Scytonema sp. PRP1 TaxID=3120513 RepID=UPI002FD2E16D
MKKPNYVKISKYGEDIKRGNKDMGARLRVFLTREQDRTLLNLRSADVPQKVKDRAEVIRLNAHGWYVEKIAAHFNWTPQTVREVLHKWEKHGLQGLWELPGRGGKTKYKEEDIVFLEECLKKEPRTYNSLQLAQKLERDCPKGTALRAIA